MKTMKKLLVFLVIAALLVPANVFAASADIITSHVVFEGEASSLKASAFVRDLSASPEEAVLIIAAYEGGKLIACESASGINKILRTEAIDASGAEMVKAFVWSKVKNAVISEIAEYNSTPLKDDVVIKIGGEVIDFDENGNYDYASVATAKGELTKSKFNWTLVFWLVTSYIVSMMIYFIGSWWWTSFIFAAVIILACFGIHFFNKLKLGKESIKA